MDNDKIIVNEEQELESGIDFVAMWQSVKSRKKLYVKVLGVTFVLVCIYAFSLPRTYQCQVMLAPELSTSMSRSSISSLAATLGMNLGAGRAASSEALYPTLYPDLMNSVDFKTSLFPVKVRKDKEAEEMTYYHYLEKEQKSPWWSAAMGGVMKAIGNLILGEDTLPKTPKPVNPFRLTKKQTAVAKMIDKRVVCDVDKKTLVITIQVTDQDPLVCATLADSVQTRLQTFITEYRTSKSRKDLEYNQKLYVEAKHDYDRARKLYAEFCDANQDLILQSVRMKQTELENELQLKYNTYSAVVTQLEAAKAKVQEETPAFTTLQSATVPLKPAGPKRLRMALIGLFLAFLGTTVWAFHKDGLLKPLLGLS